MENRRTRGRALFDQQLQRIVGLIDATAARRRLAPDERDDLYSRVMLRLVEDDFAVLRAFQHRSSWRTYLTVVIQRVVLDGRVETWGRWRPAARSRRLGSAAVLLDRRINRDGLTPSEAVAELRLRGAGGDPGALEALADRIPRRAKRWFLHDHKYLAALPGRERADRRVEAAYQRRAAERVRAGLGAALEGLPARDRELLALRFGRGWTVRRIADRLGLEAKPLYRRFERMLRGLRRSLERCDLGWSEVSESIGASRIRGSSARVGAAPML